LKIQQISTPKSAPRRSLFLAYNTIEDRIVDIPSHGRGAGEAPKGHSHTAIKFFRGFWTRFSLDVKRISKIALPTGLGLDLFVYSANSTYKLFSGMDVPVLIGR